MTDATHTEPHMMSWESCKPLPQPLEPASGRGTQMWATLAELRSSACAIWSRRCESPAGQRRWIQSLVCAMGWATP